VCTTGAQLYLILGECAPTALKGAKKMRFLPILTVALIIMFSGCATTIQDNFHDPSITGIRSAIEESWTDSLPLIGGDDLEDLLEYPGFRVQCVETQDLTEKRAIQILVRDNFRDRAVLFNLSPEVVSDMENYLQYTEYEKNPHLYLKGKVGRGEDHFKLVSMSGVIIQDEESVKYIVSTDDGRPKSSTDEKTSFFGTIKPYSGQKLNEKAENKKIISLNTLVVDVNSYQSWRLFKPEKADFLTHKVGPEGETVQDDEARLAHRTEMNARNLEESTEVVEETNERINILSTVLVQSRLSDASNKTQRLAEQFPSRNNFSGPSTSVPPDEKTGGEIYEQLVGDLEKVNQALEDATNTLVSKAKEAGVESLLEDEDRLATRITSELATANTEVDSKKQALDDLIEQNTNGSKDTEVVAARKDLMNARKAFQLWFNMKTILDTKQSAKEKVKKLEQEKQVLSDILSG